MRTRSTGTSSLSTVRIGLIFSVEPIQALAAPIRPPRRRNSSVSTANHILNSARAASMLASTAVQVAAVLGRLGGGQDHQPGAARGRARVHDPHALAPLSLTLQLLRRLAGRLAGPGSPSEMCIEAMS